LVVEAGLGTKERVEVVEEGAFVGVPASIRVAIVDGKLGLSVNVEMWSHIYAPKRTKLKVVRSRIPDPLVGVSKNAKTRIVCANVRKATLNEPRIA
jgi:hypothetical protein